MPITIVNTDSLSASANNLRNVNRNINSEFQTLQNKAQIIDNNWQSPAGDAARTAMRQIFKHNEARSSVIRNYINMLEQQVNPGYADTETVNIKLADKFK